MEQGTLTGLNCLPGVGKKSGCRVIVNEKREQPFAATEAERLLTAMIKTSPSVDCAVVREETKIATQTLDKIAEAYWESLDGSAGVELPRFKPFALMAGAARVFFDTASVASFPSGVPAESYSTSPEMLSENAVSTLARIRERASFPIRLRDGELLGILLGLESSSTPKRFSASEVIATWAATQSVASSISFPSTPISERTYFNEALRHMSLFVDFDEIVAFKCLVRILCSGLGLGWHRAWVMKPDDLNSHSCVFAVGGINRATWGVGARAAQDHAKTLLDEIATVVRAPEDCTGDGASEYHGMRVESALLGKPETDESILARVLTEFDDDSTARWAGLLDDRTPTTNVEGLHPQRFFAVPITSRRETWYIVLSCWEDYAMSPTDSSRIARIQKSRVEVSCLAATFSQLSQGFGTVRSQDNDPERFLRVLDTALYRNGIPPVERSHLEAAIATAAYEQTPIPIGRGKSTLEKV